MKKMILCAATFLLLNSMNSSYAQMVPIDGKDLELQILHNNQAGKNGYSGLFTQLDFSVEDFSLLNAGFEKIKNELKAAFQCEEIVLLPDSNKFRVIYDKTISDTDGFLKSCKDVLSSNNVYLTGYEELTLVRK